jgi:DNA processing protein
MIDWLRLIRSPRVGATTFRRLLAETGSIAAALDALPGIAAAAGVDTYQPCPPARAEAEFEAGRRAGARPLFLGAPAYPGLLADCADAPPLLWAMGRADLAGRPAVALAGARNASALGQRMAGHLAERLGAQGLVVVSGLARGIDAAAHRAALPTGTVAVLAGGIDVVYPRENQALMQQIARDGLLLSEMPPGLQPQARHFPRRNRIISGLASGLVVVEGAAKSGSLITARTALDQGREVMAVPGHPFDARAAGCNMLIRDGATLVRSADDILQALALPVPRRSVPAAGPAAAPPRPAPRAADQGLPRAILNLLGPAPISEDALIRQLARPPAEVMAAITELDLAGQVQRHPGGLLSGAAG